MKTLTKLPGLPRAGAITLAVIGLLLAAGGGCEGDDPRLRPLAKGKITLPEPVKVTIASPEGTPRPPFAFSPEDDAFLTEVQHGAFNYLWFGVSPESGMVLDRPSEPVVSVAGVGFQLAGIPVGIERGWITREQGRARVEQILEHLLRDPAIRKAGLFQHFIDAKTSGIHGLRLEHTISTIDSALLFCGMMVAGEYFGGSIADTVNRVLADADWASFVVSDPAHRDSAGFVSLGWKPASLSDPSGAGELLPYAWLDSGCEHRLVTFLAVAAEGDKGIPAERYYQLRRGLGQHGRIGPMVWFPYSGALFVQQFSHIFLNYAARGPDHPESFGVPRRARVDWWENSRLHTLMHRQKAIENPRGIAGFGPDAWGLTASDGPKGYMVPGLFPEPLVPSDAIGDLDYATKPAHDDFGDGTIAPYAAGCSILFEPRLAIAAMRHYRQLAEAKPELKGLWSDPAAGGFGFADAYNESKGWVAPDHLAIDHGPLLLAIENARTGLIWNLFERHPIAVVGWAKLTPPGETTPMPVPPGGGAGAPEAGVPSGAR